jgi:hypothetical protein
MQAQNEVACKGLSLGEGKGGGENASFPSHDQGNPARNYLPGAATGSATVLAPGAGGIGIEAWSTT